MLNRLKHIGNAALLGLGAGLNFGCAIVCGIAGFLELSNAVSKKPVVKTYTVDISAKDIPETTKEEDEDDAGEEE